MNYLYTWMHNRTSINSTFTGSTSKILNLTSIKAEDVGEYSCSVSNGIQPDGVGYLTLPFPGNQKIKCSVF